MKNPTMKTALNIAQRTGRSVFAHISRTGVTLHWSEYATLCPLWVVHPDGSTRFLGWNGPTPSSVWNRAIAGVRDGLAITLYRSTP